MCGRYDLSETARDIGDLLKALREMDRRRIKTGEIFPSYVAPVLRHDLEPAAMIWGYPRWTGKGVIFNARSETAATTRMFAKSFRERRCVIPTTGFYEWRSQPGHTKKVQYHFHVPGQPVTWIAGLWARFDDVDHFTMLTTAANPDMAAYHDRMPVVIHKGERSGWIEGTKVEEILQRTPPRLDATPA